MSCLAKETILEEETFPEQSEKISAEVNIDFLQYKNKIPQSDNSLVKSIDEESLYINNNSSCSETEIGSSKCVNFEHRLSKPWWRNYSGFFLALLSSFLFSLTGLVVKHLENFHPISIAVWRYQGTFLPALPLVIYSQFYVPRKRNDCERKTSTKNTERIKVFLFAMARSVLSCNALLLHLYALQHLNLGDASVISSTTPVFVSILAHYFLAEKCGIISFITVFITIVGVGILSKPPLLTGNEDFDSNALKEYYTAGGNGFLYGFFQGSRRESCYFQKDHISVNLQRSPWIGTSLSLGCTLLSSVSLVMLRYIRKIDFAVTTLYYGAWGTLQTLTLSLALGVLNIPSGMNEWLLISALIILSFLGQLAIIGAFKCEQAGPVCLVKTCDVIFAYSWQVAIMNILPDKFSIIGASIVVLGIAITAVQKWIADKPDEHAEKKRLPSLL